MMNDLHSRDGEDTSSPETNGAHDGSQAMRPGAAGRILTVLAAAAVGGVLGGFVFKRAGRLAFAAAVAFIGRDVWLGQGRTGLEQLLRGYRRTNPS